MPEQPNITDLQRKMRTLQSRLTKEQGTSKALRTERTKLNRRVGTLERQKERLDNQIGDLKTGRKETDRLLKICLREKNKLSLEKQALVEREDSLIQENRRLAERTATVDRDLVLFRDKAEKAVEDIQAARKETAAELNAVHAAERKELLGEREQLQSELSLLTKQIEHKGKIPLLPPEKVANLLGDLVDQLGGQLPGMKMRTGEITLKVAFGAAGDVSGFLIPTPDADQKIKESLHELTISFDRAAPVIDQMR